VLNRFLKLYFTIEIDSLQEYLHRVKDLLIQLTTRPSSPILTNVFSKFSNILQPFTSYSYDLSLDSLKQELTLLKEDHSRMKRKTQRMSAELEDYRVKSAKSMEFIYMLRVGNINVDELYRRGVSKVREAQEEEEDVQIGRVGMEVYGEEALQGINQESNLTSQYVSIKSKR
jgi:hypothetical protein